MKELVDNEKRFADDIRFSYHTLRRKVTVPYKTTLRYSLVTSDMYWDYHQKKSIPNPLPPITAFKIFTFTVILFNHNMSPGDALILLLQIVSVEEKDGQQVSNSFVRPQYVPVSREQFESIEVNGKRDARETVPFEFGRVLLSLHFRQSRPVKNLFLIASVTCIL